MSAAPILLRAGALGELAGLAPLREATGLALIGDRNTDRLFRERVEAAIRDARPFARASFPAGEANKTWKTAGALLELLARAHLDRGCVVVALGGGVVTDVAGYVASVYLRGVKWVAAPTTLLAMVDAAIGGKTGVDLHAGKNLAGSFHPPAAVVADLDTLSTLPRRDRVGGLAEVVKMGIAADPKLFEMLEQRGEEWASCAPAELEPLVRRAVDAKNRVVEADPRDTGARLALNLGHTTGHALEAATQYQRFHHGEAVSIGIAVVCALATRRKLLGPGDAKRIVGLLEKLGLPARWPADVDPDSIRRYVMTDKKSLGGSLRVVLPSAIGKVVIESATPEELIAAARGLV